MSPRENGQGASAAGTPPETLRDAARLNWLEAHSAEHPDEDAPAKLRIAHDEATQLFRVERWGPQELDDHGYARRSGYTATSHGTLREAIDDAMGATESEVAPQGRDAGSMGESPARSSAESNASSGFKSGVAAPAEAQSPRAREAAGRVPEVENATTLDMGEALRLVDALADAQFDYGIHSHPAREAAEARAALLSYIERLHVAARSAAPSVPDGTLTATTATDADADWIDSSLSYWAEGNPVSPHCQGRLREIALRLRSLASPTYIAMPKGPCGCSFHMSEKECDVRCVCSCNADFVRVERWECQVGCKRLLRADEVEGHDCQRAAPSVTPEGAVGDEEVERALIEFTPKDHGGFVTFPEKQKAHWRVDMRRTLEDFVAARLSARASGTGENAK